MVTVIDTKIMLVIYAVLIGLSSLEVQVLQDLVFAYHGKEVSQVLDYGHFVPLTIGKADQVKVIVNYSVNDPSIIGQDINAVMKIYTLNGTLLKTSSFPAGLALNETGKVQLATSFTDIITKNITAVVTFVNTTNNLPLSNSLTVKLNFEKAP
jgi:hypothetical protein